jgi:hypothetical protein
MVTESAHIYRYCLDTPTNTAQSQPRVHAPSAHGTDAITTNIGSGKIITSLPIGE